MERLDFLKQLEVKFPDAFAKIDDIDEGLLHCEMAAFRRYVEEKMDQGSAWYCEKALCFVEQCLRESGAALENAIEVSFIEDLALGEHNRQRYEIVKERAPKTIRNKMIEVHEFWK